MHFLHTLAAVASLIPWSIALPKLEKRQDLTILEYEYVVVGSGAGGGPLAARLALAGHKTLLIEAGDDQGGNVNYSVPAYEAKSTEDLAISWDFFVRHYSDDARQKLDFKLTYDLPNGGQYIGLDPPEDATIKGILYPRTATLGGCTAHNALVTIYPDESDFQYIADLTGDTSWNPENMRSYWKKLERNHYRSAGEAGHGYDGWLSVETANVSLAYADPQLLGMITGAVGTLGNDSSANYNSLLYGDANAVGSARDETQAIYQIPVATNGGARNGAREFILSVSEATNEDGTKKYPLDVRLNCFATKVSFETDSYGDSLPRAYGVEFLDGKSLYRADARAKNTLDGSGKPGCAHASREVIISGGSYNTPQLLKLSGIGPQEELEAYNIPIIADLPGVGSNLQDHYEVVVQAAAPTNFSTLDGCNFAFGNAGGPIPATDDPCYNRWLAGAGGDRGPYASSGFAAALFIKSSPEISPDNNYGLISFGGPVNFRGYFPGYSFNATENHNYWSWAILKSHPRNTAGTVTLRSIDPLDTPEIVFNYFDTGSGDFQKDLDQIAGAIEIARAAIKGQGVNFTEILPGAQTVEDYIKQTSWGHHASSTCAIGNDTDPLAVLDSSFRVRKVQGLRVVDASVYPKIPGTFTAASTYIVAEKAADVILSQLTDG